MSNDARGEGTDSRINTFEYDKIKYMDDIFEYTFETHDSPLRYKYIEIIKSINLCPKTAARKTKKNKT